MCQNLYELYKRNKDECLQKHKGLQSGPPAGGGSVPWTGRDAVGWGAVREGAVPLVEMLNHFNSVTTALCKYTQSFITVTAVIAVHFSGAVGLGHKDPLFLLFSTEVLGKSLSVAAKTPQAAQSLLWSNWTCRII